VRCVWPTIPTIITHARLFAHPLLGSIIDQLDRLVDESERSRLRILRQTLAWQQTVEGHALAASRHAASTFPSTEKFKAGPASGGRGWQPPDDLS
jgi:hypothetical protein